MRRTLIWSIATALIVTVAAVSSPARQLVEIRLRGHYYAEPATVQITVAVEPAANHRALVVEADSPQYFRSSALPLDGESEKRLHTVEFKNLPAGAYTLRAELRSLDEILATATQDLVVTGTGGK